MISRVLFLRYLIFCIINHPKNFQICNVMMSISTWEGTFWISLLYHNSLDHKIRPTNRFNQEQCFSIWQTGATSQALCNLPTCSNYSTPSSILMTENSFVINNSDSVSWIHIVTSTVSRGWGGGEEGGVVFSCGREMKIFSTVFRDFEKNFFGKRYFQH